MDNIKLEKVIDECFMFLRIMGNYLNRIGAFEDKNNLYQWYDIYGNFKEDIIWELIALKNEENGRKEIEEE